VIVDITLGRVCATIGAVGRQWVLHILSVCVCNHSYPACNAHAPYCRLWPLRLYCIFRHYLINDTIFGGGILKIKCVLILSTTFVWNVSIPRRNEQDMIRNVYRSSCGVTVVCLISMNVQFSRQIFEKKCWNIKFNENPSNGIRVVPCGRTDRQTRRRWYSFLFCNFAKARKIPLLFSLC